MVGLLFGIKYYYPAGSKSTRTKRRWHELESRQVIGRREGHALASWLDSASETGVDSRPKIPHGRGSRVSSVCCVVCRKDLEEEAARGLYSVSASLGGLCVCVGAWVQVRPNREGFCKQGVLLLVSAWRLPLGCGGVQMAGCVWFLETPLAVPGPVVGVVASCRLGLWWDFNRREWRT